MNELDRFLPLNPRVYAILLTLADGPSHGYRIKQEVEARSDGAIELDPGSLYRAIAKLVRDGLIEESPVPDVAEQGDARRRYYGLTNLGLRVAEAETRRLTSLVQSAAAQSFLRGDS